MQRNVRFSILSVVLLVLGLLIGPAGAQETPLIVPQTGPCAPGGGYDPACDADHDSDVDIFDIQLTAGHWNQAGTWMSDNNHNHLGQTWTGSNNPLELTGAFAGPDNSALLVSNSAGNGLGVTSATATGIHVDMAGTVGVFVSYAGGNGLYVQSAGSNGLVINWASSNGVYVGSAGAHGVYALTTNSAYNGVYGLNTGGGNGMRGDSNGAITSGVYGENTGGGFGVAGRVINGGRAIYGEGGSGWAGWFNGNVTMTGSCAGCLQANFAINRGMSALQKGDVVRVTGVNPTALDNASALWEIAAAAAGQAAVGVVATGADLLAAAEHLPTESGQWLVPRAGAVEPGDYALIVYSGPMQVRLAPGESAITAGMRLTTAADGTVRPLLTRIIAGMIVSEGAPVIGVALELPKDGLVWVLVNPQ